MNAQNASEMYSILPLIRQSTRTYWTDTDIPNYTTEGNNVAANDSQVMGHEVYSNCGQQECSQFNFFFLSFSSI